MINLPQIKPFVVGTKGEPISWINQVGFPRRAA